MEVEIFGSRVPGLGRRSVAYVHVELGSSMGVALMRRGDNDPHVCFGIVVEDDGHWFLSQAAHASTFWLPELAQVIDRTLKWLEAHCDRASSGFGWKFRGFELPFSGATTLYASHADAMAGSMADCNVDNPPVLSSDVPLTGTLITPIDPRIAAADFLFSLLDNIDTAGDMVKSDDKAYRAYVERTHRRRFEVATTDGYTVTFKAKQA